MNVNTQRNLSLSLALVYIHILYTVLWVQVEILYVDISSLYMCSYCYAVFR